jgi:hypothetical protein
MKTWLLELTVSLTCRYLTQNLRRNITPTTNVYNVSFGSKTQLHFLHGYKAGRAYEDNFDLCLSDRPSVKKPQQTSIKVGIWVNSTRYCFILLRIDQAALHVELESNFSAFLNIQ